MLLLPSLSAYFIIDELFVSIIPKKYWDLLESGHKDSAIFHGSDDG